MGKAGIAAANFPFCTIEPNVGVVPVPDPRLNALAAIVKPQKCIPTAVEFVDIAGLVAGAASGEGLGNKFLAHIREVDAITHVVRCFENEDVIHVNNRIDPLSDIDTIDTELALADLDSVDKALNKAERSAKTGDKDAKARAEVLGRISAGLNAGKSARSLGLSDEDKAAVRDLFLLTLKPVMYVANVLEDGFENNPHLDAVRARAATEGAEVVPVTERDFHISAPKQISAGDVILSVNRRRVSSAAEAARAPVPPPALVERDDRRGDDRNVGQISLESHSCIS